MPYEKLIKDYIELTECPYFYQIFNKKPGVVPNQAGKEQLKITKNNTKIYVKGSPHRFFVPT